MHADWFAWPRADGFGALGWQVTDLADWLARIFGSEEIDDLLGAAGPIKLLVLAIAALAVYFFPYWVALLRRHHSVAAVFALNLLLGWTFVFWVLALVWALSNAWPGESRRRRRYGG